jgi:Tfp pilus assembly protein PilF
MSIINDYTNRQLIPRLLTFETSNILSLNISSVNSNINDFEFRNYSKLKIEWETEKNIILAIEMLVYEIVHNSLTINIELITFLNSRKEHLNQIEKEILFIANAKYNNEKSMPSNKSDDKIFDYIKKIKKLNRINPLNSLQWCNLGYYYTKLGQKNKAKKAFLTSIGLNNSNRHIVRSVARFFLHIEDIEFGHKILTMSPRINNDASLISAEIAYSELMKKRSKFIDKGIKLKDDENISVFEKNELLAQIATLEFSHGKNSKGKLLVEKCLLDPNENSLAQISFLKNKRNIESITEIIPTVIFQYEALARSFFSDADFEKAFENAKEWFHFQPFSDHPASLSTYIATEILDRQQEAIDIAKSALTITPDSVTLKNNLAFALAKNNRAEEALNIINGINKNEISDYDRAVLSATDGFIAFKLDDLKSAKFGYDEAIKYFRLNKNDEISLARALYNYSNILDKNESNTILREVSELSKKNSIVELNYLLERKQNE